MSCGICLINIKYWIIISILFIFSRISDKRCLLSESSSFLNEGGGSSLDILAYERRVKHLECENRKLAERAMSPADSVDSGIEVKKLSDQVQLLSKQNKDLLTELSIIKRSGGDIDKDIESRIKDLERQAKVSEQNKENACKELIEMKEKLNLQTKELQDALAQRKLAMSEYSEVSDKLTELRNQKQKMSRQVRDKEEELETAMQKIDTLRQDLRKAEKLRRELEARVEEAEAEATKERKLRERSEEYTKGIEVELEKIQERPQGRSPSLTPMDTSQDARLKTEIDRLTLEHEEKEQQMVLRHNHDTAAQREQLAESESARNLLQNEVTMLTKRVEQLRTEVEKRSEEQEDSVADLKRRHEHEKAMMLDDNKKMVTEVERLTENMTKIQSERRNLEEEYEDLRNKKESIAQWEAQITEIIQW